MGEKQKRTKSCPFATLHPDPLFRHINFRQLRLPAPQTSISDSQAPSQCRMSVIDARVHDPDEDPTSQDPLVVKELDVGHLVRGATRPHRRHVSFSRRFRDANEAWNEEERAY